MCSRNVCVMHSAVRYLKRILRPRHSRRKFWIASGVRTLAFILAWPFTQSTIVLLHPLISSVNFSRVPTFQGQGEADLLVSLSAQVLCTPFPPFVSWTRGRLRITSSLRGRLCHEISPVFLGPTAHLCCGTQPCASTSGHCSAPTPYPKRTDLLTMLSFSTRKWNDEAHKNWNVSIIHGPSHNCPNFSRNFLRQQRKVNLPPTKPHEPRCSFFTAHPGFV